MIEPWYFGICKLSYSPTDLDTYTLLQLEYRHKHFPPLFSNLLPFNFRFCIQSHVFRNGLWLMKALYTQATTFSMSYLSRTAQNLCGLHRPVIGTPVTAGRKQHSVASALHYGHRIRFDVCPSDLLYTQAKHYLAYLSRFTCGRG